MGSYNKDILLPILKKEDIPECYRNTPIEKFLCYHNLNHPFDLYEKAEILALMCMDYRKMLNLPENFAYIIRNSGAKIKGVTFALSFAVAVAGINTIAVIGHSDCKMINVKRHRAAFVNGLVRHGWKRQRADKLFSKMYLKFEIKDEIESIVTETKKLRSQYPKTQIVPLYYKVKDKSLCLVIEDRLQYT